MRRRRSWGREGGDQTGALGAGLVGLGGWLFADLLLALGLIFLVSMGAIVFAPGKTGSGGAGPSPGPPARPGAGVCTKTIATRARTARFDPGPSHVPPTDAQLALAFGAVPGEEEGLVQTKVTDVDIDRAYQDAQAVNARLRSGLLPGTVTDLTHFDDLGWQDPRGDRWLIEFTVYPYVLSCPGDVHRSPRPARG